MQLELGTFSLRLGREKDDVTHAAVAHRIDERIVSIQNCVSFALHYRCDDALHICQLLDCVDSAKSEMISRDIQDDADVALVESQSCAKNSTARCLENSNVHCRIRQDDVRRKRTGHVTLDDNAVAEVRAIGRGESDDVLAYPEKMGNQANCSCLSVRTGDRNNRNRGVDPWRIQHVNDGRSNISRPALAGMRMHSYARARIDLDDDALVLAKWNRDVRSENVDAGDVQSDHAGGHLTRGDI